MGLMEPSEPIRLPIHREFVATEDPRHKPIHWKWRATTQSGELVEQSVVSFETSTACEADAEAHGSILN